MRSCCTRRRREASETLPNGWLLSGEAALLTELAEGRVVLELGAWKGRSTVALARSARLVVSVDWHRGDEGTRGAEPGTADTLTEYLANVRGLVNVVPVIGRFEDVCPLLSQADFGLVFIDGAHDSASVARDVALASACSWGVLAAHDWNMETVRTALRDVLGEPARVVDTTAVWE